MIWRGLAYLTLGALLAGQVALANAPDRSMRPTVRPGSAQPAPIYTVVVRYDAKIRPRLRPGHSAPAAPVPQPTTQSTQEAGLSKTAVARSLRPLLRPKSFTVLRDAPRAAITPAATPKSTSKFGSICGSRAIRGQKISKIPGKLRGCGLSNGVKVSEVSGVRLSTPSIMDCTTAKALDSWVRKGVSPAVGRLGGGLAELKVVAHYSCRTRNNRPGAKISEHGKGRAVDIAGLTLKNGAKISVLKGWRDPVQGKVLKQMHKTACGPFGTVLGPNADRYHKDHLHLDTARHRGGAYCR
ncbi:extensin family protein [Aliiroseovarius crassostreae]|uniref:extensin-like domain-containing protein n=1 Tax=Aliiroseovarius crassostreae TaxID=154981 RepID=UPI003C7A954D